MSSAKSFTKKLRRQARRIRRQNKDIERLFQRIQPDLRDIIKA